MVDDGYGAAAADLRAIVRANPALIHILTAVAALALPDCWVAAGCVRNAVWDHLHHRTPTPPAGDVDVIWFDAACATAQQDRNHETMLCAAAPAWRWSVKNQARMHDRNGDAPYASASDAMRHWPETATAVGIRLDANGDVQIVAPFGLADLFSLRLCPTSAFEARKRAVFDQRVVDKRWLELWPALHIGE